MRPKAGKERIERLCREEYARYFLSSDEGGFWWKDGSGKGCSRPTAEKRGQDLGNHVAGRVLERIGIDDWSSYPWHRFCKGGAVAMVAEIVRRDVARREAEAEAAPWDALLDHVSSSVRR